MNTNLLVFNLTFYLGNFLLYLMAQKDPSSSLGIAFFGLWFWLISLGVLVIFLRKKVITLQSIWDRVGIFLATPVLLMLLVVVFRYLA